MSRGKKAEVVEAPVSRHPEFDQLQEAAELLIGALPNEMMRSILHETARSQFIPLWMLVTGLLQRVYDNGEHTTPVIDPMWLNANPVNLGDFGIMTCGSCGESFTPRWPGQEFCCVLCGNAASRDRIAADRKAHHVELATYQVGNEPPGVSRSTVFQVESDRGSSPFDEMGDPTQELGALPERADPITEIERDAQKSIG